MATELDTSRHQYESYRFCFDNGHKQWLERAQRCFKFWSGNQWDVKTKAKLTGEGRPALTFNIIESLVRSMKGIQRALRNDVRFLPQSNATIEDARVRDAIWLNTQQANDLDFIETDIWEKGLIMGRAYYEVRVNYDNSFQGHITIKPRRSQDIVLDPTFDSYDPDDWPQVYDRRWVSRDDIVRMFGKGAAEGLGNSPLPGFYDFDDQFQSHQMGELPAFQYMELTDQDKARAFLLLGRQYFQFKRKDVFVDVQTGDTSEIPETWDRNRVSRVLQAAPGLNIMKRDVRTVRWTVTCEDRVLHDQDSPYNHFTIVPFFPTMVDGITMGLVESMLDPQELFNKITSQELHIINTTANSGWKVKRGALQNMTVEQLEQRGAKAGFVAELDDIQNMEKIQPNNIPQGHDRLSFKADQIMRSISGVSNQARGFAREDVAGEAIMANQAAQDVNFAGPLGNLHRSKRILASRVDDCSRSHYTETRVLQITTGSIYDPSVEEVTLNQPTAEGKVINDVTAGRFTTTLVPAPSRTTMTQEDFELMLKLRIEAGIMIPDALLIELCPASNKAQLIKSLQGDSAERQKAADDAAAATAQAEAEKSAAQAEKERAAARLNDARAAKFAVEAQTDPDASFERTEFERLQHDERKFTAEHQLEREKFEFEKEQSKREMALQLTQIDAQRQTAQENNAVKSEATKAKGLAKKPAGKKPAK